MMIVVKGGNGVYVNVDVDVHVIVDGGVRANFDVDIGVRGDVCVD